MLLYCNQQNDTLKCLLHSGTLGKGEHVDMKNIVNIVNFVRGIEPRPGRNIDLVGTVREEIAYLRKNDLVGTFLLQYDALINPEYAAMLRDSEFELGVWFETVQPQVEATGDVWRGRFPWDWHNDVGFLIGYDILDFRSAVHHVTFDIPCRNSRSTK